MVRYVMKRLLIGLITIFLAFTLTFVLTRVAPGNPIRVLAGKDNPNPDQIAYLTSYYGLDKPLREQYVNYITAAFHGDFGRSIKSNRPVVDIISEKVVPTLILSLTGSVLSILIGTALGLYAGRRIDSWQDRILVNLSYIIDAIPSFWLSMMFIMLFATRLRWFPTTGMYSIRETYTGWARVQDLLNHMVLPVAVMVIISVPYYFRVSRASVRRVLEQDFIHSLRALGMRERKIYRKYVLKNALIPVITASGMALAFALSGVALIEIVFAWPGMGRVIMNAVTQRDYNVLSGVYLMLSICVTVFMILTDLIYAWVDPRIRLD